jgi:DUF1009 family protein
MSLALIAGQGGLPGALLAALPERPYLCALDGFPPEVAPDLTFRIERLVPFLNHLSDRGITQVCLAGAIQRPRLDPSLFDAATANLVPALMGALAQGDDGTLRFILSLFEENGQEVVGVEAIAPGLLPEAGVLAGALPAWAERDAARAEAVVAALGRVDVGQGCVVSGGLVHAVEALPGTDAMLASLSPMGGRGLFYKGAKPGQDRRVDLPTVGLATLERVIAAGLGGLVIEAGSVICLDRAAMVARAAERGIFLWARGISS